MAEQLFVAASELKSQIDFIRSPMGQGPPAGEEDDGTYDYRRRLQDLNETTELFREVQKLKIRQVALIGDEQIDSALQVFFRVRAEIIIALQGIIR